MARSIGTHHAMDLQLHLEQGALLLTVCVETPEAEARISDLLAKSGGTGIRAYSVTRYVTFDDMPFQHFHPFSMMHRTF